MFTQYSVLLSEVGKRERLFHILQRHSTHQKPNHPLLFKLLCLTLAISLTLPLFLSLRTYGKSNLRMLKAFSRTPSPTVISVVCVCMCCMHVYPTPPHPAIYIHTYRVSRVLELYSSKRRALNAARNLV